MGKHQPIGFSEKEKLFSVKMIAKESSRESLTEVY